MILLALACDRGAPPLADPDTGTASTTTTPTTTVGALVFEGAPPRNLLVISMDTLRRDHVDPHTTDGVARTPFLAARLAEAVRLEDHQQCSNWTFHAMSCTLIGHPVEDLGWTARLAQHPATPLPDEAVTLAERLADAGFTTVASSSNGYFGPDWATTQGYAVGSFGASDALTVGRAGLDALEDVPAPWFLHLHVKEPHDPYAPPAEYLAELDQLPPLSVDLTDPGAVEALDAVYPTLDPDTQALARRHLDALYSADIRWMDDQLATVWAELEAAGHLDDALVVFFTDHGEGLFEHGTRDHARGLYREENDAVLAFWARNLRPTVWSDPTHAVDLVPTVLAALDLPADERLTGAVVGTAPADRPRFATAVGFLGPMATVTQAGDRLLYRFDGALERYDLDADPGEQVDLHAPGDPRSQALWALLEPVVTALDAALPDHSAVPPLAE